MKDIINQALQEIKGIFGEAVFANPTQFKNGIGDILGGMGLPVSEATRLRNLLGIAIGDMRAHTRLKEALAKNESYVFGNLVYEIEKNFDVKPASAQVVMECIVELLGHQPPARTTQDPGPFALPAAESRIKINNHDWLTLDQQDGKVLLLYKHIWDIRPYNKENGNTNWAKCTLQKELNNEFYNLIEPSARAAISITHTKATKNPWFGTGGGEDSYNHIFLLSIEEIVKYFGDSTQLKNKNPRNQYCIDDQFNPARIALNAGEPAAWWLRTPGDYNDAAAYVNEHGVVRVSGAFARADSAGGKGVRPALWLEV